MGLLAQNPQSVSRILVSQQPGRSLPVTGLPLENLADLGSPASNLP
jgi:hypothetical protein